MIIAFTGHRPDKLGSHGVINPMRDRIKIALAEYLKLLLILDRLPITAISGMALGFDQWAAEVCIDLNIPFEAAVPFEGQEKIWPTRSQEHYRKLLAKARRVEIVCSGTYSPEKMSRRNEWMVDRLVGSHDRLVGVWDGTPGGTRNCVAYASVQGKRFINLWERVAS